jgi:putative membrane protein
MMMFGSGWAGPLWMIAGVLLILGVILVVIWAVQRGGGWGGDDAMRILRERFARGEIDVAQFEEGRRLVGSGGTGASGNRVGWIGLLLIVVAVIIWVATAVMAPGGNWNWGPYRGFGF